MGQTQSEPAKLNAEQVASLFARRCAKQFTPIELWSLKKTFQELAVKESDVEFWDEPTFTNYLGIPDSVAPVSSLLFRSASFLAGFPFVRSLSPAPLTLENLCKVLAFYDGKYKSVMKPNYDWLRLIFLSLAVVENVKTSEGADEDVEEDEDDLIVFTVNDVESWNELELSQKLDSSSSSTSYIIDSDLAAIFTLALLLVDYKSFEDLSDYADRFTPEVLKKVRASANAMVQSITGRAVSATSKARIGYPEFKACVETIFPHILAPYGFLLDHLLFQRNPAASKDKEAEVSEKMDSLTIASEPEKPSPSKASSSHHAKPQFSAKTSHLVHRGVRGQLYSIYGDRIETMVKLYSGGEAGFSMRAFETKVFNWNSPTILLVKGTRLTAADDKTSVRRFNDLIAPVRGSQRSSKHVVFGAYLETPWKANAKEGFADSQTTLFQLAPEQDIYRSVGSSAGNFAYFSRGHGLGFGSPPPHNGKYTTIGNVSLLLEDSFEYGVFRHFGPGGSFQVGHAHGHTDAFEDRFSIDSIEVWGCGTEDDLAEQRSRWEWEDREAMKRQRINVDSLNEDRALLEMAGLIGKYSASGGSV